MIHPTAVIHPHAHIGEGTRIGPYAVIDAEVRLGPECEIGPHVYITGNTVMGRANRIHAGAVIGDLPQDLRFKGELTAVVMGDENLIREHVTIHRSNNLAEPTRLGNNNLLMADCHVGHNAVVGNHVIIANGTLVGGHSRIQDRAFLSGTCLIHQGTRVGTLCLMQGGSGVSKDLPPYTIASGNNSVCGLNTIGLRRAGFTSAERLELRRLYQMVFRSGRGFRDLLPELERDFTSEKSRVFIEFLKECKKGFCLERRRSAPENQNL
jgi:UDP-N-acetylglucosamine acyltransferase